MKLRIDGRFIALQALGCIACYALCVLMAQAERAVHMLNRGRENVKPKIRNYHPIHD